MRDGEPSQTFSIAEVLVETEDPDQGGVHQRVLRNHGGNDRRDFFVNGRHHPLDRSCPGSGRFHYSNGYNHSRSDNDLDTNKQPDSYAERNRKTNVYQLLYAHTRTIQPNAIQHTKPRRQQHTQSKRNSYATTNQHEYGYTDLSHPTHQQLHTG